MSKVKSSGAAYEVVDARTDKVVASYSCRDAAYADADRRDARFGAVRYRVVRNYEVMSASEFAVFMDRVRAERVAA